MTLEQHGFEQHGSMYAQSFFSPSNYYSHTICGWLNMWMQNYRYGVLSMGLEHPQYLVYFGGGLVTKLCPTLVTPMDSSLPGSSVRGIFQARILEWVSISFFKGLPDPGIEPGSPALQILYQVNYEG